MLCYEINLYADGTSKVREGLTWKRNGQTGKLSLDTPGESFILSPTDGLPNQYLLGLQVFIPPLWDLKAPPPTLFVPVSSDDSHDGILALIRSELAIKSWAEFIAKPFKDLADVDSGTIYGKSESDRIALVYLDFDLAADLKIAEHTFNICVDEEGGISINPEEVDC